MRNRAAAALAQSLAIRQQLDSLPPEFLPRERQALLARVQTLDDRIDEALRQQVRGIFAKQRTHTADALRKDYLEVGLKNPGLLKRLTDALVAATEALNQEETGATNSHVQAQQRWQAVYDACNGKQPELAAARKKAKGHLPPWWQKHWPLLAGSATLVMLLALAIIYVAPPREGPVIAGLEPSSVDAASGPRTLIVSGSNFADDAVVEWVGKNNETVVLTPTLRSTDRVTVTVGADLLQQAGTVYISVRNGATNLVSSGRSLTIQALTATPTYTPVTLTDTPVPPTNTPVPPTPTPSPIVGDLPCVLKLTVSDSGEAKLPIDVVTVGESKSGPVAWSFSVLPVVEKDCGQNGQSDVEEIIKRGYRFTPADEESWILERTSPTLRLKKVGPLKVELAQEWRVKALSENQDVGSLTFGLEYQISAEEWKTVQGSDGQPLQITLTWGPITVATVTPTATPKPTRTPTPTPSWLIEKIILTKPTEGETLFADKMVTFEWAWDGPALQGKQTFQAQFIKNGTEELDCHSMEKSCQMSLSAGDYTWWVWIEDGTGKRISDESSKWTFVVREPKPDPKSSPK